MADDQAAPDEPVQSPLGPFEGREPPAPDWFKWAVAQAPERSSLLVDGANIEMLAWGQRGKPGILLTHGNTAHADWWTCVAPFWAEDYRVVALSLSGMGGSDHRERYSFDIFIREMHAVAQAGGLYDAPVKPIYIGHSFGGSLAFYATWSNPAWARATILIDSALQGPPPDTEGFKHPQTRTQPNRVYPILQAALARFRFSPPQECPNPFIADLIARRSLKRVTTEDGGEGWTWRFDPFLWSKLDRVDVPTMVRQASALPIVHIFGDKSSIAQRVFEAAEDVLPVGATKMTIPDSEHHVMVDQPLALVTAIRGLLIGWP